MIRKSTIVGVLFSILLVPFSGVNGMMQTERNNQTEYISVERTPDLDLHTEKSLPGFQSELTGSGAMRFTLPEELVPITREHPFVALGTSWKADVANAHQITLEVRSSTNTREWTSWIEIEPDHHVELESGTYAGVLIFLPPGSQYMQYRVTLAPHIMNMNPRLESLRFDFINPGITSTHELDAFRNTVPEQVEPRKRIPDAGAETVKKSNNETSLDFVVDYSLPEYVRRTEWGASLGLSNTANRSVTNVSHLIVHHSAGNYIPTTDFAAVVRSYYSYHTGPTLGWADIGYNWLVDRNGVIYQGRAFNFDGNMNVVGAHFSGRNGATMGICIIGTYTSIMPTEIAIERLRTMLAWKANERNIDVLSRATHSAGNIFTISGHRDGGATECPGQRLYDHLPTIRKRTHAFLNPPVIDILAAESVTVDPTTFVMEIGLDTRKSDVVMFVEYGTSDNDLEFSTGDFEFTGGDEIIVQKVQLAGLTPNTEYFYRVVAVNSDTFTVSGVQQFRTAEPVSVDRPDEVPATFVLEQNYPNPFNPVTNISFMLREPANVRVIVYNSQGQIMAIAADRSYSTGRYQVAFDASGIASGVLVYALEIDGQIVESRKMLLLR